MSDFSDAPCVGRWWLFDSTELNDHLEARALCVSCPAAMACDRIARDCATTPLARGGGGPIGTWAGRLWGHGKPRQYPSERPATTMHCGTERAYQQHYYRGETACTPCKTAHAAAERARVRQRAVAS